MRSHVTTQIMATKITSHTYGHAIIILLMILIIYFRYMHFYLNINFRKSCKKEITVLITDSGLETV